MIKCFLNFFSVVIRQVNDTVDIVEKSSGVILSSSIFGIAIKLLDSKIGLDYFGISMFIILFVIGTIFTNSFYGIRASIAKSMEYKQLGDKTLNIKAKKRYYALSKKKKFSWSILEDVFFKVLTLLMYLFMANFFVDRLNLQQNPILKFVDVTAEVFLIIPVFIFWYKEFKKIGKNYEILKGRKSTIYRILEDVIEIKIENYLNALEEKRSSKNKNNES